MKNKYLTKYLCITLFSAMVITGSVAVNAAEESELLLPEIAIEEEVTPAPKEQPAVTAVVTEKQLPVQEVKEVENNVNAANSDVSASETENKITGDLSEAVVETPGAVIPDAGAVPPVEGGAPKVEEVPGGEVPNAGEVPDSGEKLPVEGETPEENPGEMNPEAGVVPPVEGEAPELEEVPGEETPDAGEVPPAEGEAPELEEIPGEETPDAGEVPPAEGETPEEVPGEETPDAGEVPPAEGETPGEETPDAGEVPPAEGETPEEIPGEETPDAGEVPPVEGETPEEVPDGETPDAGEIPETDVILPSPEDTPDIEVFPPMEGEVPEDSEGEEESGNEALPVPDPTPGDGTNNEEDESEEEQVIDEEKVSNLMHQLNKLMLGTLTAEDEGKVSALRAEYDSLTENEKELIENYHLLVSFEAKIEELKKESSADKLGSNVITQSGVVMPSTILTSTPVYYTSMVSNLHAGKEFYLDSLKSNYQITFSDDFASVMAAIEREHKAKYKIEDNCDKRADGQTSSADTLLARNWQDVIAIYIYEKSKEGYTDFHLSALCKEDLARIFEELNPIVRDKDDITRVTYADRHINYYIKANNISKEDRELLKKYVENDCKLLCATVTAAKGFVRQSVGDAVSEERVNVITAAYSLVGKVGYFWGGKSNSVGENPNWGTAEFVSSPGSNSTGTLRAFGLDCSGFVSWAVINGYQSNSVASSIGDGTTAQWLNAQIISEAQAQPGDLVFQSGPEAGENNHVGILCGQTEAGDWIAIHCSSSKNGVTVGEAYGASFRYIRQPSVYPSDQQLAEYNSLYGYTAADTSSVYVTDNLTQILAQTSVVTGNEQFQTDTVSPDVEVFTDVADVVVFGDTPDMVGGFTEFVVE